MVSAVCARCLVLRLSLTNFNASVAQSDSHNLKYMGIDALGRLIKISPDIAEQHQLAVIDCLEVRNVVLSKALHISTN